MPATPTTVAARAGETGQASRCRVDVGDAGGHLGHRRRVGAEVPLVQPDRADVHRVRGRRRRGRVTRPGSARSSRHRCRRPGPAAAARPAGCAPHRRRRARPPPRRTAPPGSTPSRSRTPSVKTAAFSASRVAEVAQNRIRVTPCSRISAAYSSSASKARPAPRRPAGRSVDALAEPDDPGLADRDRRAASPTEQLDGVGAAVDRGDGLSQRTVRSPTSRPARRAPRRRAGSRRGPGRGTGRRARAGT